MTDSPRGTPVQLTDLRRSYGGVAALDGLTLHMEPGEFVALLGPSGCGKTTALRCLAGLEDPDSGTIVVGGNDLTKVPTNKRDMGMVFQAYSLFPHMTARQNVEFGLELRGRDKAARRARAAEMLDLVGLGEARRQVRPPDVRWPAAACRPGPGPGHRAAGAPARRAALGPGREGAHPAA
jgi:putative spermidine/putrescine transport system ATP-binding protein